MGERVPLAEAREAVLAQRRRRGMVLDADDHDTWSCGSFFTNPILSASGTSPPSSARVADRLGADAPVPPRFADTDGNVKTSAAWLIEQAGFAKGFGLPGPGRAVDQAHAGGDQPRRRRRRPTWPPWPARCATGCATPSA